MGRVEKEVVVVFGVIVEELLWSLELGDVEVMFGVFCFRFCLEWIVCC